MEAEDEEGVQPNVEDAARDHADHGFRGKPLIAQQVVEDECAHDERRPESNEPAVTPCIRQNGFGAAEQAEQGVHEQQRQDADQKTHEECGGKPGGGNPAGVVRPLFAEQPGHNGAGAVAEEEPGGLQDRHVPEDNAGGAGGRGPERADEGGVHHVVEHGNHHDDGGGYAERDHQFCHRGLRHLFVLFLRFDSRHVMPRLLI